METHNLSQLPSWAWHTIASTKNDVMTSQRNCYKLHWCSQRCSWNSSLLKTLSKPLLLYKGPNLALALKVLILKYFHLSVTERDSPSSQISSLDGTSSSYPIYKPRTDPRLPVCRKLETGFLSCPHYACFVFFRKFVFLNCRRDSQYPKKTFSFVICVTI